MEKSKCDHFPDMMQYSLSGTWEIDLSNVNSKSFRFHSVTLASKISVLGIYLTNQGVLLKSWRIPWNTWTLDVEDKGDTFHQTSSLLW